MVSSTISCGVKLVYGLAGDPRNHAVAMAKFLYRSIYATNVFDHAQGRAATLIFSDRAHFTSNGSKLASFLVSINCGVVEATETRLNPNSGNRICVWAFSPDHAKFRRWLNKELGTAPRTRTAKRMKRVATPEPPTPGRHARTKTAPARSIFAMLAGEDSDE
jgi:hypothetical protein